jgi:hypothetical protein
LGKKTLRQQHGTPVGEGLFPLPTANDKVVGEADGVGTIWPRRGFANSFSFPTGTLLGKNPFANSLTLPSVLGFWAVGKDFFPDSRVFLLGKSFFANSSGLGCWESSVLLAKPQFHVVTVAQSPASCRSPCASSVGSCLPRSLDSTAPAGMEEAAGELAEVGRRRSRGRAHRGGEEAAGSSSSVAASRSRPGGRRPQGIVQLIHINSNFCYEKKKKKKVEKTFT